jgi:general stress protein 26
MASEDPFKKLQSLIKNIDFAMMTTTMSDGTLRSRPMASRLTDGEFDGTLWFFTHDQEPKVHEILENPRVNLAYADPSKNDYVSVSGEATLVKDKAKAKELWNPFYKAWFPDGLDDAHLGLIRVDVTQAEYWDSPNSKMVQLAGFVKAMITGKEAQGGENEKTTFQQQAS